VKFRGVVVDEAQLRRVVLGHPSTCPDQLCGPPRLVENPSAFAPTWRLERFRDLVRGYAEDDPADPDWPEFVACTEAALAYRAAVPPEYRFWRDDDDEQSRDR
jgi:hypothetical protein